ncbi:MAG: gamma-glutamylcyclotransferase [Bdellovibrionaceae bacterium]|nr:gamma-glutamylcyclotransferase [Pseudobdellovibrionaceae bacterium]MBX3034550.1 gamma-glutamylcyclotransferase [Pseudobdellovibrionaceae bacterium]
MTTRFFVFGAMSEGMVHWSKIADMIEASTGALIRATAWRLKVGYPVLLKGGSSAVRGQLVSVKHSDLLINLLDEFHGCSRLEPEKGLHRREEVEVLADGADQPVRAWVYYLNPKKLPGTARPLEDGDWQRSLREDPALTDKLTERQRTYLMRLGAATGREIVPINDMSLYRELMNLDLIVDKGRRLALSKFGQEVVRHLG